MGQRPVAEETIDTIPRNVPIVILRDVVKFGFEPPVIPRRIRESRGAVAKVHHQNTSRMIVPTLEKIRAILDPKKLKDTIPFRPVRHKMN
jgi:hypothetical protein